MEFGARDFEEKLYNKQGTATYFYRVIQDVVSIKDKTVVNSYHHLEDFKNPDLRKARIEAIEFFKDGYMTLPEGFVFPFLSPEEHNANPEKEYSAYSHSVLFIEFYNDDVFEIWPVAGEDDEQEIQEGLDHETEIWLKNGWGAPPAVDC
ncbi:MAG TPA: hypothetical protein VK711_10155 [Puia sp.]|nr:hypothetical protein [Puia sp.]